MIPGLTVDPEATAEDLENGIGFMLSQSEAIMDEVTDLLMEQPKLDANKQERVMNLAFAAQNMLEAINEAWNDFVQKVQHKDAGQPS